MKEFKVLPTDQRFQDLSMHQINFIIASMNYDVKLQERANKGIDINTTIEDSDTSWWDTPHDEFDPIAEGHDEDDIARQVEERLTEAERKSMKDRFEDEIAYEEYIRNGGVDFEKESIKQIIHNNLEELREEAQSGEFTEGTTPTIQETSEEDIQEAINLFDEENDDLSGYM